MPGFIPGSRGPFSLDVLALLMVLVVPLLAWSLVSVRCSRDYGRHKHLQVGVGVALGVTLVVVEIDVRFFGWRHLAEASPYYDAWLFPLLYFHLLMAVSTTVLWAHLLTRTLREAPSPPRPFPGSARHRVLGRLAAAGMFGTAVTGWLFYWAAFIA